MVSSFISHVIVWFYLYYRIVNCLPFDTAAPHCGVQNLIAQLLDYVLFIHDNISIL